MLADRHLMTRLQCGDADALRRIYVKYKDDLLTLATCLLLDASAAEDVLHDVFVTLAEDPTRLNIRRNLKGYLMTSVANRARDNLRRRYRRNRLHSTVPPRAGDDAETIGAPPADLNVRAVGQAVCKALEALPHEQREVIALHLHGTMTFKQIARFQGIGVNTAKSRYRYGLDKLRSLLNQGVGT